MSAEPLDTLPLWGFFLAANVLLLLTVESGYRIGMWRHARTPDERDLPVGGMVASILGLLALLLGFTFSMAASRFEARRQTVLEEANAIGTTYLRARLLPEQERVETEELLREYVDVRIRDIAEGRLREVVARSEEIHELLWAQAVTAAEKNPNSIMTGVYVQALNNVIDLHAKRVMVGLRSRVPVVIWAGLFGLAVLGMASVGYHAGLSTTRRSPAMLGLVLAFSVVLALIADLDRGHEGLLRVSQQAMIDVQQTMHPKETSVEPSQ
jgi:hypothetical protein